LVTIESIRAAAAVIADGVMQTPCTLSRTLSAITGARVVIKFENHQFTASFKERGALNALTRLSPAARAQGVLAVSAGNHAQGVAYHAKRLGIRAVIVMPRFTPSVKVERTRDHGAEIVLAGDTFDEARKHGLALAKTDGYAVVHPYDDEDVISGQGTVALEMLNAFPDLECLVVPIGGGGLITGMAVAAKAIAPAIDIVGVQTVGFPAVYAALRDELPTFSSATIAEGIAVEKPGGLTLPIIKLCSLKKAMSNRRFYCCSTSRKPSPKAQALRRLPHCSPHPSGFAARKLGWFFPAAISIRSCYRTSLSAAWYAPDAWRACALSCAIYRVRWQR
jgi:threonine dehydratase